MVPVSGWLGDNLVPDADDLPYEKKTSQNMSWWKTNHKGLTLIEYLDLVKPP